MTESSTDSDDDRNRAQKSGKSKNRNVDTDNEDNVSWKTDSDPGLAETPPPPDREPSPPPPQDPTLAEIFTTGVESQNTPLPLPRQTLEWLAPEGSEDVDSEAIEESEGDGSVEQSEGEESTASSPDDGGAERSARRSTHDDRPVRRSRRIHRPIVQSDDEIGDRDRRAVDRRDGRSDQSEGEDGVPEWVGMRVTPKGSKKRIAR